jgi:UDP-glucose 4-epimerase
MVKAEDLGDFFRIPADTRDLNYNRFFIEGEAQISQMEEYNSHNTLRLDIEGTKKLLMRLDFIQEEVAKQK